MEAMLMMQPLFRAFRIAFATAGQIELEIVGAAAHQNVATFEQAALVVVDLDTPNPDTLSALEQLNARVDTSIPVVALTNAVRRHAGMISQRHVDDPPFGRQHRVEEDRLAVALGAMVAYDLHSYQQSWEADLSTQAGVEVLQLVYNLLERKPRYASTDVPPPCRIYR